jgi:AhpD family alkylhydroperoxidase
MTKPQPIAYKDASPEVKAVYDDIMASRGLTDVNNFWKYLANDPRGLKRTWESVKEVMAPGALDPVVKEMVYLAVSVTNNCGYCIASHSAAAARAGMTPEQFGELMAVVGMANETNRLVNGYRVTHRSAVPVSQPAAPDTRGGLRQGIRRCGPAGPRSGRSPVPRWFRHRCRNGGKAGRLCRSGRNAPPPAGWCDARRPNRSRPAWRGGRR